MSDADLYKERFGEVKNLVLETIKKKWIRSGRRDRIGSQASSKRDREDDALADKNSRLRVSSPVGIALYHLSIRFIL